VPPLILLALSGLPILALLELWKGGGLDICIALTLEGDLKAGLAPLCGVYGEMSELYGRLGGIDETLVNAADDFRPLGNDSILGRMESFSSLERPLSASYGDGDVLILGS
jgi:hypothetical protein